MLRVAARPVDDAGQRAAMSDNEIAGGRGPPEAYIRGAAMLDPQAILVQAGQGRAPANWRVFTKERGRVRGWLRGTTDDPDPLLVVTDAGVVEYVHSKKPITVIDFDTLGRIALQVSGSSSSDSTLVHLSVWLDLHYRDGRKSKWRSASFGRQFGTVQAFIEAYGAYQALRANGLQPR